MIYLFRNLIFLFTLGFAFGNPPEIAETTGDADGGEFIVYYFHTAARCATCLKIERQAREVIETDFTDRLDSGQLEWKVVDVESPENSHFVEDFQLLTKSLVLVEQVNGAPHRFKTLDKVWEFIMGSRSI